ncbi:MAG: hypothetical protein Q7R54_00845 [bacterium]|nr:hypothetical protein [bacterium]
MVSEDKLKRGKAMLTAKKPLSNFPVWQTIHFVRLGASFERLADFGRMKEIPVYGETGSLSHIKGPVSPKGMATLIIATTMELGFGATERYSYLEFLTRAHEYNLTPCRYVVGPQLVFNTENNLLDGEICLATDPNGLRNRNELRSYGYDHVTLSVGYGEVNNEKRHRYLNVGFLQTEEKTEFYPDTGWVFETIE